MPLRKHWCLPALVVFPLAGPAIGDSFDYFEEYSACVAQPAHSAEGAAIGDCFDEQAKALEMEIRTQMYRASKSLCSDSARSKVADTHDAWRSYRETYCDLISGAPDNTDSGTQASACRLDLARKRLDDIEYLESAYMWCSPLSFIPYMSHFGEPVGQSNKSDDPSVAWEGLATEGSTSVRITGVSGETLVLDTSNCEYCKNGTPCNDGMFALWLQTEPSELHGGFGEAALFHVCSQKDGSARLDIIGDLVERPAVVEIFTGNQPIEWAVDEGQLRVVVDGDIAHARFWPNGVNDID